MTHHNHDHNSSGGHSDNHSHHIVPLKVYYMIWVALIVGTVVTVATSYIDFGGLNIYVAMFIATIKAMLVIMYFMGLKYDGYENNVTFFSGFFFLLILVLFTAGDIFKRPVVNPLHADATLLSQSGESVDILKISNPSEELMNKGKQLFTQQCATCHGSNGQGDGPAAASLNPKPRNFTQAEGWKKGRSISKVFDTITNGLPGTPMPGFSSFSVTERMSLAHYVRSLTPNAPKDSADEMEALKKFGGAAQPKISIKTALEAVVQVRTEEPREAMRVTAVVSHERHDGEATYQRLCMSCHAADGRGGVVVEARGAFPNMKYTTAPLSHSNAMGSMQQFQAVVTQGIPGRGMPGFAQFSNEQWQSLYQYVRGLR